MAAIVPQSVICHAAVKQLVDAWVVIRAKHGEVVIPAIGDVAVVGNVVAADPEEAVRQSSCLVLRLDFIAKTPQLQRAVRREIHAHALLLQLGHTHIGSSLGDFDRKTVCAALLGENRVGIAVWLLEFADHGEDIFLHACVFPLRIGAVGRSVLCRREPDGGAQPRDGEHRERKHRAAAALFPAVKNVRQTALEPLDRAAEAGRQRDGGAFGAHSLQKRFAVRGALGFFHAQGHRAVAGKLNVLVGKVQHHIRQRIEPVQRVGERQHQLVEDIAPLQMRQLMAQNEAQVAFRIVLVGKQQRGAEKTRQGGGGYRCAKLRLRRGNAEPLRLLAEDLGISRVCHRAAPAAHQTAKAAVADELHEEEHGGAGKPCPKQHRGNVEHTPRRSSGGALREILAGCHAGERRYCAVVKRDEI